MIFNLFDLRCRLNRRERREEERKEQSKPKNINIMKKKIISASIALAFVAGIVALHLVQPKVSYALAELLCGVSFIGGAVAGCLVKDHIK